MRGDGSEANPYLPTTLSEFLSVCNRSAAYIKLTQDIDAYDDPTYVGELTTVVRLNCQKLYADTPVAIKNVTVRASNMIWFSASNSQLTCTNIHFLNWIHKKVDNSQTIRWTNGNATGYWTISNCKFSIKIDNGSYYPLIFRKDSGSYYIYFKYCSFYFEYPEDMIRVDPTHCVLFYDGYGLSLKYCNMIIKNLSLIGSNSSGYYLLYLWQLEKTSIIFDTLKMYNPNSKIYAISATQNLTDSRISYSYIAFVNPIITSDSTLVNSVFSIGEDSLYLYENCIYAKSDNRITYSGKPAGVMGLTLEQLKDKEYLEGIGWLP